jgi:putative oxidoreductase
MAHPVNEPVTRGDAPQAFPGQWAAAAQQPAAHPWRAFLAGYGRIESLERYGALAARLLLAHIFFLSALGKIMDWEGTELAMTKRGMFWVPLFLVVAIAFELGGSLSLIVGYKARLGALALFLFLIPTTLVFHNFWTYPADHQKEQMINFMKNIAIMGGLWMVISFGPGLLSLDAWNRRPADT